jgi:hypothetical protein
MRENETITVYWAPAKFTTVDESWNLAYAEPQPVLTKFIKSKLPGSQIGLCPSVKDLLANTFALTSNMDDQFKLFPQDEKEMEAHPVDAPLGQSKLAFYKPRESSFPGHVNVVYNLSWLFFASEPVTMRLLPPFFPASSFCDGALLAPGEVDVGRWFRPMNLDLHIPSSTKEVSIREGQELAYIEFITNKKIVFKRYSLTAYLHSIARDAINAPARYGKNLPLEKRYRMFERAGLPDIVLSEIRKNLV